MAKEEITPSKWQIMEVLWACGEPLTSSEVYKRMRGNVDMSMRMVRVLMNRLNQKDILGYTVDEHNSRVYHYYVLGRPAVPFVGEPVPDSLPETVPGGYGGYLRQGVHTGQREDGA